MPTIFQYGSNMSLSRIEKRIGSVEDLGRYDLQGYSVVFDLFSEMNRCGVANIVPSSGKVIGRLFNVTFDQLKKLDTFEGLKRGRYKRVKIDGYYVYVSDPKISQHFIPSEKYVNYILTGLEEINAPISYRKEIEKSAKS